MKGLLKVVLSFVFVLWAFMPISSVQAETLTVCASGCDHATIQAAIDAAAAGDTISVGAGTYNENVVINKNNITLIGAVALNPNDTPDDSIHTIINSASPASVSSPGITINSGITGVTIKNLRVQNFTNHNGIYGVAGNNDLTIENVHTYSNGSAIIGITANGGIFMNGPVSNVFIDNVDAQFNKGRGIVIWNGFKQGITITNNYVANNNCCGIELQDGSASGVTITGNTVIGNSDSGISVIGATSGAGANTISNNTVTNNGRFGIEIKVPNGTGKTSGDGSIIVESNTVSLIATPADLRDYAGIAVIRRGFIAANGNVDIPTGVIVQNNTVSGYIQNNVGSTSTGFGIVVEGIKMQALNNTVSGNDVGLQIQAGHMPYAADTSADGDQSNLDDDYFGRGNSPVACVKVAGNSEPATIVGSGASEASIFNQTQGVPYCGGIQEAINAATAGDVLEVDAGTYVENLTINKSLTLQGAQFNIAVSGRTAGDVNESTIQGLVSINATDVTINGFTLTNPGGTRSVFMSAASSNINIAYNIVDNVGGPSQGAHVHAIYLDRGSDSVTIENNRFNNIQTGGGNFSVSAVGVLDSSSTNPSENLVIQNNIFNDIVSATRAANGIQINNGSSAGTGGAPGAQILNNTFSNISGAWTHAIGLETSTPNAVVSGNIFSNLIATGMDNSAIFFEKNSLGNTVTVFHNQFNGDDFYGVAIHPNDLPSGSNGYNYVVDASENWWNVDSGPDINNTTDGALIGLNVTYSPWCADINCTTLLSTKIEVRIGGELMESYFLSSGESVRDDYNVNNGPVIISSQGGTTDIIAAMRVIWQETGQRTSYTELMGLPKEQLSSEYWFPWYNNLAVNSMDQQFRFGVP